MMIANFCEGCAGPLVSCDCVNPQPRYVLDSTTARGPSSPLTLGEALPIEQARVRVILGHYKEIGAAGMIGGAMIEQTLRLADEAAISGDVLKIIGAYNALREIEG